MSSHAAKNRGRSIKIALGWLVSLIFLYLVFSKVEWGKLWEQLKTISPLELIALVVIYLCGFTVRALRSQALLPQLNLAQGLGGVLVGYAANNTLPARLGEFVRAQVVGQSTGIKRTTTFSSIIVERILDGLAIVILLLIGSGDLTLPPWADTVRLLGIIIFASAMAGVVGVGFTHSYWKHLVPDNKLGDALSGLIEGILLATRDVRTVALTLVYSLAIWAVESFMFFYAFHVFSIEGTFLSALFVMGIVNLGVLIPSSPGNLGVFQYFCVQALTVLAADHDAATAYALTVHFCQYLPVTLLGFMALHRFGLKSFAVAAEGR